MTYDTINDAKTALGDAEGEGYAYSRVRAALVAATLAFAALAGGGCWWIAGREGPKATERTKEHVGPKHGDRKTQTLTLPGGATMEMIYCGPGDYVYGDDNTPKKMDHGFWLGKCEVTQSQWRKMVSALGLSGRFRDDQGNIKDPSPNWNGDDLPMDSVSWNDCKVLIDALNRIPEYKGCNFRLPSEYEWEYACRAGTKGLYARPDLDNLTAEHPNSVAALDDMGWYRGNSGGKTHNVGQKRANDWGFCDMHGNVLEWCEDKIYDESGDSRVLRGGCWFDLARYCRSAYRDRYDPGYRLDGCGFRLCCSALP